jgi:hypothetical protein
LVGEHHPSGMRPIDDPGRTCPHADTTFAVSANRQFSLWPLRCGGPRALLLTAAVALLPVPADASPTVGSVWSGQVEISVSVAARYKLRALEMPDVAHVRPGVRPRRLCLATNSSAPMLPVFLVQDLPETGANEDMLPGDGAAEIGRCVVTEGEPVSHAANAVYRTDGQLMLIRPE